MFKFRVGVLSGFEIWLNCLFFRFDFFDIFEVINIVCLNRGIKS